MFTAVFYEGLDGWIVAMVPEVPGAHAQGRTLDEARMNLREALKMMLEENRRECYGSASPMRELHREPIDEPP